MGEKSMSWKKLLDTQEVIAYEKNLSHSTVRIEARYKQNRWRIYKTHSFEDLDKTHVKEYIASSLKEARDLLLELKKETDIVVIEKSFSLDLKRCYKEEFVEKWNFKIDNYNADNFAIVRLDSEIKLDIVLHDKYNHLEKEVLDKLIDSLGLKDLSDRICYDFFYFKKHSAKRRVYQKPVDHELVAQMEFNYDPDPEE